MSTQPTENESTPDYAARVVLVLITIGILSSIIGIISLLIHLNLTYGTTTAITLGILIIAAITTLTQLLTR